jgi:hypothetical protein
MTPSGILHHAPGGAVLCALVKWNTPSISGSEVPPEKDRAESGISSPDQRHDENDDNQFEQKFFLRTR